MKNEDYLWKLFCATGEPLYYSMYVRERDNAENKKDRRNK